MVYTGKNYRFKKPVEKHAYSNQPHYPIGLHRIQIFADLYDEAGKFYYTAPVAETFVQDAQAYCDKCNADTRLEDE